MVSTLEPNCSVPGHQDILEEMELRTIKEYYGSTYKAFPRSDLFNGYIVVHDNIFRGVNNVAERASVVSGSPSQAPLASQVSLP